MRPSSSRPRQSATIACALLAGALVASYCLAGEVPEKPNGKILLTNSEFKLPLLSRWREERILSAPNFKVTVDLGGGKELKGSMSRLSRELIDIEVTDKDKALLEFVQSETSGDIDFGKNRSRHTTPQALDGKKLLAERGKDGRWATSIKDGRRPTPEEGSAMRGLTYLWAEKIYPTKKVGVGDTWVVEAKELKNLFGSDFQKPTGTFELKFARIVEHNGIKCAKITGKGKLTGKTKSLSAREGDEAKPLDVELDLTIDIYHAIELEIDLEISMKGTLELRNSKDTDELGYHASSPVEFIRKLKKRE